MKKNNGITLIALIITIIVMLILVAVSLNILIKSNLIGIAEKAVDKYKMASEEEKEGIIEIDGKKYSSLEEYLDYSQAYKGLTITADTPNVEFTKADGTTPGDVNNLEMGDIVKYGDYEYHYNQAYYNNPFGSGWSDDETIDGWGVKAIDRKKEKYGELCGLIYGKNLKNIDFLFGAGASGGANDIISEAPEIPYGVESMGSTFQNCQELKEGTKIPTTVKNLSYCFSSCYKLEGTIIIDSNPESYNNCFGGAGTKGAGITVKGKSTILDEIITKSGNAANITKGE